MMLDVSIDVTPRSPGLILDEVRAAADALAQRFRSAVADSDQTEAAIEEWARQSHVNLTDMTVSAGLGTECSTSCICTDSVKL